MNNLAVERDNIISLWDSSDPHSASHFIFCCVSDNQIFWIINADILNSGGGGAWQLYDSEIVWCTRITYQSTQT